MLGLLPARCGLPSRPVHLPWPLPTTAFPPPSSPAPAFACMRRAVEAARKSLYAILGTLWPAEDVAGPAPSYDELMAPWNTTSLTDDVAACYEDENKPGSAVARQLAALGVAASQPNKVRGRGRGKGSGTHCRAPGWRGRRCPPAPHGRFLKALVSHQLLLFTVCKSWRTLTQCSPHPLPPAPFPLDFRSGPSFTL